MKTIIKQNETFRRTLQFTDTKTNRIIDLTGCTAYSQMRDKPGGTLLGDATCTVDVPSGTVSALWTPAQTDAFPIGDCGFDIWLVCAGEQKPIYTEFCTVVKGFTVLPE